MKLKAVLVIILILLLIGMLTLAFNIQKADCSEPPATEWTRTYGGHGALSVVQTSDGGYALAGYTWSLGTNSWDSRLVKVDSSGDVQWNKTYGGANNEWAYSVMETGDGGYALAGFTRSFGAGDANFWLVKVDSSGNVQWNKTYGGAGDDAAKSVVETSDGGYALTGHTKSFGAGDADFWLVKVDLSGNLQWNKTYGGAKNDYAVSVVEIGDGGYALAGFTRSFGAGDADFWLIRVDSSGDMEWNKTYGGDGDDDALSVVETSDGGYALAGYTKSSGAGLEDFWLVKVDSSGDVEWNQTYGGSDDDKAFSVVETGDGGYALAGETRSYGAGDYDFWLVKVGSFGDMEWNETYGGAYGDAARSVVETSDGGYALTGHTFSFGAGEAVFWLVKVAGPTHVDKFGLLAPYIALASAIIIAIVAVAVFVKYRKKQ